MFEIPIVLLCVNNAEVDFLGQFEDSGAKLFLFGVAFFGKLDFEEVEPIFWFHLLEGANLNVSHCGENGFGSVAGTTERGWVLNGLGALLCDWNNWQGVLL